MKLLLDTHIVLWSLLDPGRLSPGAARELESPENELWVSPISAWEIAVLVEKGRVVLSSSDWVDWLRRAFSGAPFKEAPLNREIAIQSRLVDLEHQDPADRFIAATAMVHDLVLVTADHRLLSCGQVQTMPGC